MFSSFYIQIQQNRLILSWGPSDVPLWFFFFHIENCAIGDLNFAYSCCNLGCWNLWHWDNHSLVTDELWADGSPCNLGVGAGCPRDLGGFRVHANQIPPAKRFVFQKSEKRIFFALSRKEDVHLLSVLLWILDRYRYVFLKQVCF